MTDVTTKSDKTRAQIIDGAIRALCETGVLGTTTRKIAAASGVRLATLHYHFESKSALLVAVLEKLIDDAMPALREEARSSADLDDCIERLLRTAWRSITRTKDLHIVQYELTLYALREGAQWLADQQYSAYVQLYRHHLAQVADGLSPAASSALARFMVAGIDGLILQELAKPSAARSKQGLEALIDAARNYARQLKTGVAD
ncbi:TetR/AcrR family transcriptional regulator [Bradyrhizobium sp. U87765 SZCCT0131]|uniref:TetR/AcrR family transcriptional regulator n=1 Tax=unclassified Bradyrhizobium TaxID=2631580 RepID=UPI001BA59B4E|nr:MULTISPECIES: TetR/AcrR family transcriptional regulator [unclassified Bradyrhizobium]MBR1218836.1 TetR/AcrR family transcriptional regulator [Bradyrhizobium sp. U87765 SZCCT0131]MBR1261487.1 TetR/AcrR family transcriptional regulator [Bradyrhizobium sp. U87765 SZCCT0134]MBR1306660.1 TetR/AcrR family transcriptional regulator [Bradyrhizobium sp. U87765 SZCCT0110]MBR1317269.1 TetR/AcrR family transcriptional regulator [Bradyrhizobium sp. U87765 SZCCT0109]MBR1350971.1 TetR/AcrR family transcr